MEPQIRYCTTSDGASIAYASIGAGPVVIMLASVHSFAARMRLLPDHRALCEAIAMRFTLVQYDGRGMGLSARERHEYDLTARLNDLDAVAGAAGAETFALFGWMYGGFTAIAYAAGNPQRVTSLVLYNSLSSGERWFTETPRGRLNAALGPVTEEQWEFVSETIAASATLNPERRRDLGAVLRESWSPADFLAHRHALREIDVTNDLARVSVPTLVVTTATTTTESASVFEHSRELASAIHGARLHRVTARREGWSDYDYQTLVEFLSANAPPATDIAQTAAGATPQIAPHGTAIILFADIADSTALTERLGDAAFRAKARELDTALRERVRANGGAVIDAKTLGDGILATFPAASQAIAAALSFKSAAADVGLGLHVGLHAGDVIREQDNVFGGAVNIAARISALAQPGEVLVSDIVRGLARTSAGVQFEDRGEFELKGVGEPQRVFAVRKGGA